MEIKGPYMVLDVCRCVVPVPMTGLNYRICWGETRCKQCEKHIKWGVR